MSSTCRKWRRGALVLSVRAGDVSEDHVVNYRQRVQVDEGGGDAHCDAQAVLPWQRWEGAARLACEASVERAAGAELQHQAALRA